MFGSSLPPVICRGGSCHIYNVRYLCLFSYIGVFFALFIFILCLVYLMLIVSLDCKFFDCPFGIL